MENKGIVIIPLVAIVVLGIPFLVGMAKGGDSPTQVVEKFVEAGALNDPSLFEPLVTEKAWELNFSKAERDAAGTPSNVKLAADWEIFEETVNGDLADVAGRLGPDGNGQMLDMDMKLRKENGEWRIFGFSMSVNGVDIVINFEKMDMNKMGNFGGV